MTKRKPTEIQRRVAAAQRTLNHFLDKPLQWGRYDCGQMVKFHLRRIGRPLRVKLGVYSTPAGVLRAIKKQGCNNAAEVMDSQFPKIPWAAAREGDVISLPAADDSDALGALGVWLGNGRALIYHEDAPGACVAEIVHALGAWRVVGEP